MPASVPAQHTTLFPVWHVNDMVGHVELRRLHLTISAQLQAESMCTWADATASSRGKILSWVSACRPALLAAARLKTGTGGPPSAAASSKTASTRPCCGHTTTGTRSSFCRAAVNCWGLSCILSASLHPSLDKMLKKAHAVRHTVHPGASPAVHIKQFEQPAWFPNLLSAQPTSQPACKRELRGMCNPQPLHPHFRSTQGC